MSATKYTMARATLSPTDGFWGFHTGSITPEMYKKRFNVNVTKYTSVATVTQRAHNSCFPRALGSKIALRVYEC